MSDKKKFEEMLIKEFVKQMINEAKPEMDYQKSREKDKKIEEKEDLNKFMIDLVYKSSWESDKGWLKGKLKDACQDLYGRSSSDEFPYTELFIIGLYGVVAEARDDLSVDEFQEIINDNCDLINDLY